MSTNEFTIDRLRAILRESVGEADDVNLDGDIADTEFADLGCDSVSLLEAASHIERYCGIELDDEFITSVTTPRALVAAVNEQLARTA